MIIDVDKLPEEGLKVSKDFFYHSLDLLEESAVFLESAHAEMVVRKVGEEVWIKGSLKARLNFVCSRCLTPFEYPVDSGFDLAFIPEEFALMKEELGEEDIDHQFFQSRKIDIREVILEQLNLIFPMKPLCLESCEGICPVCGRVRKSGDCACMSKENDPRLEKFKLFMKDKG